MSESVSAPGGGHFHGLAEIAETGRQGMITLRGDLGAKPFKAAAAGAAGLAMPGANAANVAGENGLCWMSPDEMLVLCPYGDVAARLAAMQKALSKVHALAVDVSDARAVFRVSGSAAREVLAKLCPVDLSPAAFAPGMFRRTRMAQVPAAFWMDDAETFRVVCFRSVADYVFGLFERAADPDSAVGYFRTAP